MVVETINSNGDWPTKGTKSGSSLPLAIDATSNEYDSQPGSPIKVAGLSMMGKNASYNVPESTLHPSAVSSTEVRSPTEIAHIHKATFKDVCKETTAT